MIVGDWEAQEPELQAQIKLHVDPDTAGELTFYTYPFEVEVDLDQAPAYLIEVNDGFPTVLECWLADGLLKCPEPYQMDLVKKASN